MYVHDRILQHFARKQTDAPTNYIFDILL